MGSEYRQISAVHRKGWKETTDFNEVSGAFALFGPVKANSSLGTF